MKAAIYCRLSEEDKNKASASDDSGSIQNQKAMLLRYAMDQGWEIYNIYSDDDYAGADRRRPEFNRLLKDAEQRKFDIVLCKTQSRFTRELELVEKYIHGLFPLWGIRFISIVDNADTANKGNKKSRQINGLVNEWYLEDMSENIRSVLNSRRENGLHIGAFALYGYRKDPAQKGHLLIDEDAAAVVQEIFTLFAEGYGKTAIARILNDRGIPNPTEYKHQQGLHYRQADTKTGSLWKYSAISAVLRNEMYTGTMVQGRYGSVSYKTKQNRPRPREEWYIVEGTHDAIIGRELWDKVQKMLAERSKPFAGGTIGLFAGKARCAHCGSSMRSSKNCGRHYLQCSNHHIAKNACPGSFIAVDRLEELVRTELHQLTDFYLDPELLLRNVDFYDDLQNRQERLRADIAAYEKKSAEYAKGLRELYLDKVKGLIREPDYLDMAKEFKAERERLENLLADTRKELAESVQQIEQKPDPAERMQAYVKPVRLTRALVVSLIDYIAVGKRISGTRIVPIEIHWNF